MDQTWLTAPTIDPGTIRAQPLVATPDERTVEWLTHVARHERIAGGTHVVDRWSSARDFHVIVEGLARVTIDGARVAELGAGDFFGELALVKGLASSARAVAVSRTSVLELDRETLEGMRMAQPAIAIRLIRILVARLIEAQRGLALLAAHDLLEDPARRCPGAGGIKSAQAVPRPAGPRGRPRPAGSHPPRS